MAVLGARRALGGSACGLEMFVLRKRVSAGLGRGGEKATDVVYGGGHGGR